MDLPDLHPALNALLTGRWNEEMREKCVECDVHSLEDLAENCVTAEISESTVERNISAVFIIKLPNFV